MELAKKRPAIGQALSSLRVISANARKRSLYEAREKGERDQRAREHAAEARGRNETLLTLVKNMHESGFTIDKIEQVTKLSKADINEMTRRF
ncbi:hypothetical protein AGMMS49938_17550 [Fibrobacterales bacterium]|nr:hypothetical protein AGMMS49938_17550 [Fibrobacterales bacterium]